MFSEGTYSIVPIRYDDRMLIMKWRNEQIYHLRQLKPLTETDQEKYFRNVVTKIFEKSQPDQILFSYLENDICIGYGGLVHINWVDQNAELSFIIDTKFDKTEFYKHWNIYLRLIEKVAFQELKLHKIFTYAFDLRPLLYKVLESNNYVKEAILKEHCYFEGAFKDVVIHSKIDLQIDLRRATLGDKDIIFEWANDEIVRKNSFNSECIKYETHSNWYDGKINDKESIYFIGQIQDQLIGLVRFDRDNQDMNNVVIGIQIDRHYRGKGLASMLLEKGCNEYLKIKQTEIIAYIKEDNLASIRSFEKAGFLFEGYLIIKGIKAVKYKFLKKDE